MLANLRKWLILLFTLISILLGLWICVENTLPAQLTLLGYSLPSQPLGLLIIVTFAVGTLTGVLGNVVTTSWLLYKLRRMQKRLNDIDSHRIDSNRHY